MSRPNPLVADALAMLAERGLTPTVSNGGKHIKVRWIDHGRNYLLTVSRSPSDHKAMLRSRTILRRLLSGGEP